MFDSKNFVINVPLQTEDVLTIKFSAKGSKASTMEVYGEKPCIELDESTSQDDLKSTAKDDYKVIKFVATKGQGNNRRMPSLCYRYQLRY